MTLELWNKNLCLWLLLCSIFFLILLVNWNKYSLTLINFVHSKNCWKITQLWNSCLRRLTMLVLIQQLHTYSYRLKENIRLKNSDTTTKNTIWVSNSIEAKIIINDAILRESHVCWQTQAVSWLCDCNQLLPLSQILNQAVIFYHYSGMVLKSIRKPGWNIFNYLTFGLVSGNWCDSLKYENTKIISNY